ncbi:DsrE family protein [Psychroflexus montanilacus]|uniref:DsrE family protein n=1 Tax=Psychroflexus montanilacus TaxID=2873598 RepID=UPI001CC94BFD|nr:DsrE family protein [Psychroflexus montanilacus]MBZ9651004.1 DsrE family protein [Psychroflexus montanilacus]
MKHSITYITALLVLIMGTAQLKAQTSTSDQNDYVVLSKNIKQLKPILMTATSLAEEDGENYGEFQVVFCGKTVADIRDNTDFQALLKQAAQQQMKVYVCGLSLQAFEVNPEELPQHLEVVENGIFYGFQLKKQGFISLTI